MLQPNNSQNHIAAPISTLAGQDSTSVDWLGPAHFSAGAVCRAADAGCIAVESSRKSIGRLRWVVDSDREEFASFEAGRHSDGVSGNDAEREASSLSERVSKNLALIRAYEAKNN